MEPAIEYAYSRLKRHMLLRDLDFAPGARAGQSMPDFDLLTTDGARIRRADYLGKKPLLMIFGSYT